MAESKFTPGSWSWEFGRSDNKHIALSTAVEDVLYATTNIDDHVRIEINEANARLIAAAPDLLEACEFALSVQKNSHGIFDTSDRLNAERLEAAIKKARGESEGNND